MNEYVMHMMIKDMCFKIKMTNTVFESAYTALNNRGLLNIKFGDFCKHHSLKF